MSLLQPFTTALLECLTFDEAVTAIIECGIHVLGAQAGLVALLTPEKQVLTVAYTRGYSPSSRLQGTHFHMDAPSPLSDAVRTNSPVFLTDRADLEPQIARYPGFQELEPAFPASLSLPLATRQRPLGALHFSFAPARALPGAETDILLELARQSALALERTLRQEEASAEQRDTLERQLQQSEERFRLLVEGVQDYAIFLLDPEGHITTWNAGAQRFKGYKAYEIIVEHFSRFYTPEDIARRHPWNELEIAIRDGRYEEEGWRVRKDGTRFWANVVITALRDDTGTLRGFAKVTRDVTERRERERSYN